MAKKAETKVPETINSVEALQAKISSMREAQKKFATFTQEQVDKIFFEAAMAANKMRMPVFRGLGGRCRSRRIRGRFPGCCR